MTEELKVFFHKIKDCKDLFLLFRLYNDPSSILGNKQDIDDNEQVIDEVEQEYLELPNFDELILNNNLSIFLDISLDDEHFRNKLDLQLCRKLHFFLWDSIDFRKYYHFQNDEDLMKCLNQEISVSSYLEKKGFPSTNGNIFGLIGMYEIYIKYKKLFDYNYSQQQVDDYDEKKANGVRSKLNFKIDCFLERIQKDKTLETILTRIAEDNYNGDKEEIYLHIISIKYSHMDNFRLFDATVCKNKFLDIMDELLHKGEINGIALDHAIEIVDVSIGIKNYTFFDAFSQRERLGKDRVNEFDLKRAEQILSKLFLLKLNQEKGSRAKTFIKIK